MIDSSGYWTLAATFALAFTITLGTTPLVRKFALAVGRVAYPKSDRWHTQPTALLGGIAIFAGVVLSVTILQPLTLTVLGILSGIIAVFLLGLTDDFLGIKPYVKLAGQMMAAAFPLVFGIHIEFFSNPVLAVLVTLGWFIVVTNAFNLLDNMDGLSTGIAVIAALVLGVDSLLRHDMLTAGLALAVCGAALGFLPYNFHPARIFMGDCGSMVLGFALAAISITGQWRDSTNLALTLAIPFLVLAVPLFDTTFVTITRTLSRRRISQGGRDHTSHRLVFLGMPEPKAVVLLYTLSGMLGLLALAAARLEVYTSILIAAGVVIFLFFFGVFLGEVKVYEERDSYPDEQNGRRMTFINSVLYYKKQIAEVAVDAALIVIAYFLAYLLRFEWALSPLNMALIAKSLPIFLVVTLASLLYFRLYQTIWRYIGLRDLMNVLRAVTVGTVLSVIALVLLTRFENYSRAVFVIHAFLLFIFVAGTRVLVRVLREIFTGAIAGGKRILIYGADDAGELILREIRHHRRGEFKPIGFLDDNPQKIGRRIHGLSVLGGASDISRIVGEKQVEGVLIAIPPAAAQQLNTLEDACSNLGLKIYHMSRTIH